MPTSNELAILRTKLANQRTYLAYVRTGAVIAGIAGTFKQMYIVYLGLFIIFASTVQYYLLNKNISTDGELNNFYLENMPLIFIVISLIILNLQFNK